MTQAPLQAMLWPPPWEKGLVGGKVVDGLLTQRKLAPLGAGLAAPSPPPRPLSVLPSSGGEPAVVGELALFESSARGPPPASRGAPGNAAAGGGRVAQEARAPSPARSCSTPAGSNVAVVTPTPRRTLCCNLGGSLGQPSVLSVAEIGPLRAPYRLTVRYDLRPVAGSISAKETVFLAVLDAERLRRKGSGMGLDVLRASESWIARDCICLKSGKLRPLPSRHTLGEAKVVLQPIMAPGVEGGEECAVLRVIAIRDPTDLRDWRAVGAAVLVRLDTAGKVRQEPKQALALRAPALQEWDDTPPQDAAKNPEYWGVRLQQLLDLRDDVCEDMEAYCRAHSICLHQGWRENHHVCMHTPCPFRPLKFARTDDHRGLPVVHVDDLREEERKKLRPLHPDMNLLVTRYIKPATRGSGVSHALVMNSARPLRASAFITHSWRQPFRELVGTLERALDPEDTVFIAALSVDQNAEPAAGGAPPDETACAAALQAAEKVIVVADVGLEVLQRLACLREVDRARELKVPTYLWPDEEVDLRRLAASVACLDVKASLAASPQLEQRLLEHFRGDDGTFDGSNALLRAFLQARVRTFSVALRQASQTRDFLPERLRRLVAERERELLLRECAAENATLVEGRDQQILGLRAALRVAEEAKEQAVEVFKEEMEAARRAHQEHVEQVEEEARANIHRKSLDLQELQRELAKARSEIHRLTARAEQEHKEAADAIGREAEARRRADERADEAWRKLEEVQKGAAMGSEAALEDYRTRLEEERHLRRAAEVRCAAAEVAAHKAAAAQAEAEEALLELREARDMEATWGTEATMACSSTMMPMVHQNHKPATPDPVLQAMKRQETKDSLQSSGSTTSRRMPVVRVSSNGSPLPMRSSGATSSVVTSSIKGVAGKLSEGVAGTFAGAFSLGGRKPRQGRQGTLETD